ncbi:ATP-binding protein, partial [Streptacidiphilus sp. N1-10]
VAPAAPAPVPAAPSGWPAGGPAAVPAATAAPDGGLPRRTPRRAPDEPVHAQAGAVEPQAGEAARPGPEGGTLRRRVRGATLNQARPAQPPAAAAFAPPQLDAEAVRDSLEEFEAAVDRAERDATLTGLRVGDTQQGSTQPDAAPTDLLQQNAAPNVAAPQELPEGVGP